VTANANFYARPDRPRVVNGEAIATNGNRVIDAYGVTEAALRKRIWTNLSPQVAHDVVSVARDLSAVCSS
jgi:hypothetical protein